MAVSFVSVNATEGGTAFGSSANNMTMPPSLVVGNLLLMFAHVFIGSSLPLNVTAPWTKISSFLFSSHDYAELWACLCNSSSQAAPTVSTGDSSNQEFFFDAIQLTGNSTVSVADAIGNVLANGTLCTSSVPATNAGVVTTRANSDLVAAWMGWSDAAGGTPTGYTQRKAPTTNNISLYDQQVTTVGGGAQGAISQVSNSASSLPATLWVVEARVAGADASQRSLGNPIIGL